MTNSRSSTLTGRTAMKNVSRLPGAITNPSTIVNLQPALRNPCRPGWRKSCTQELEAFPLPLHSMAALGVQLGRRDFRDELDQRCAGISFAARCEPETHSRPFATEIRMLQAGQTLLYNSSIWTKRPFIHKRLSEQQASATARQPVNRLPQESKSTDRTAAKQKFRRAYLWIV